MRQQRGVDASIGVQIQNLRIFRGLSTRELATRIAHPEEVVQRWESGLERVPPAALLAIADALDVPVSRCFEIVLEVQRVTAAAVRH